MIGARSTFCAMSSPPSKAFDQPTAHAALNPAPPVTLNPPQRLIFSQHGWSDTGRNLGNLVRSIAPLHSEVIAPDLDFWTTWLRIEPLIQQKERIVTAQLQRYPEVPLRVVAHSMGGLIWTELLHRHPEWWSRLESLVLVGSPIGGSDIARMIDPLGLGIGIARDLGLGRRHLAEAIATQIPTLVIAADLGGGTDGIVTVECTKLDQATFVLLPNIAHSVMRFHPQVGREIQAFWEQQAGTAIAQRSLPTHRPSDRADAKVAEAIAQLRAVPGMTDAAYRDLPRARVRCQLAPGFSLRTWRNPVGLYHVFLANDQEQCLYAGYVGWLHNQPLNRVLAELGSSA